MEDSKSAALMDDLRNYFRYTNGDIFEMIKTAITVAASDQPLEFRTKRDTIAGVLFSGCDTYKKQSPKVGHCKTEDKTKIDGEVLTMKEILDESDHSVLVTPSMEKQFVPNCKQQPTTMVKLTLHAETKFQTPKGPLTPEKKVIDHGTTRVYDQGVALVLMMKKILEKSGDESESEFVVCDLLTKLESMELSVKTLEITMIGRTVSILKKHASEKVRQIAVNLVKTWRRTVDKCLKEQSNVVEEKAFELKSINVNMTTEKKKMGDSEKAPKIANGRVVDSSEKMDATKRKVEGTYEKAENMKKVGGLEKAPNFGKCGLKDLSEKLEVTKREVQRTLEKAENMKKLGGLEKVPKIGNGGVVDSSVKLEATKRKLQEGYEKAENMKKKRRIQVLELHEVTKQGLLPQMSRCMKPGKNQNKQKGNRP